VAPAIRAFSFQGGNVSRLERISLPQLTLHSTNTRRAPSTASVRPIPIRERTDLTLPRYEIVKTKFECRREDAERAVEALKKEFTTERVDTQDGIRIDWDNAWVHARPSNTEPIMRIIAEAPDKATAEQRISRVRDVVDRALGRA